MAETIGNTDETGWQIDSDLAPEFVATLSRWQQGDLLFDLPVSWITPAGIDPITEVVNSSASPAYAHNLKEMKISIVCSQTCDIGGEGVSHPYFLLAPLVPISAIKAGGTAKKAREMGVGYLYPVTLPSELGGGEYFVDFRMLTSASKSILTNRVPVPIFFDDEARSDFAETFAFKFRRPALNTSLLNYLSLSLKNLVQTSGGASAKEFANFEQLRVAIFVGSMNLPEQIQVVVIHSGALEDKAMKVWDDWALSVRKDFKRTLNVDLGSIAHYTESTMKVKDYKRTYPVRIPNLRGNPSW